jgi:hypothetical protein
MNKTTLFWLLLIAALFAAPASAQQGNVSEPATPGNTVFTSVTFPEERVQTPTQADLYCAGFISKQLLPNANYVAGGVATPLSTKFVNNDVIYLAGSGYVLGQKYSIIRELRDLNEYEMFPGQTALVKATGQPYAELGRVRVVDMRSKMAIAEVEFSCDPINPGDLAVPYADKPPVTFHPPVTFDRFAPASGKLQGRILLAKDFDSQLGTGMKVYMNVGSSQGVKPGDYFRAVRSYSADLKDPVDSLSFKASTAEDTQKSPPTYEPGFLNRAKGPAIHVSELPRRAVGEIVILSTTQSTATGMIVFALEDVHLGDQVELEEQQQ